MRRKFVHLIPATLLCALFACSSTVSGNPNVQPKTPLSPDFIQNEEEKIPSLPPSTSAIPEVWSVDGVDISDVNPSKKLLALTFDDAPTRELEGILTVFAAFNESHPDAKATATVFCNSVLFDENTPHLLSTACALGFELGNHTHSHADLTRLTARQLVAEIERTDEALAAIDGRAYHLLRAPFGRVNDAVRAAAKTPIIDWTIDTLDWTGVSENAILSSVLSEAYAGAIVLLHDGYGHTTSALNALLPALYERGFQVVSLSKMIKAHGCQLRRGQVYIRVRKGR